MARKTFKGMSIYDLSRVNVIKLSTRELRSFIQEAVPHVEEAFDTDNEQLEKSLNIIREKVGSRIVHGEEHLIKGYSSVPRNELITRARLFQSHLSIDVFTSTAEDERREMEQEVKDKLSSMLDIDLSDEEWNLYMFVMHDVRKLTEKFESKEWYAAVATIIDESRELGSDSSDIIYTIHEVWEMATGKGWTVQDIQKEVMNRLRDMY